jgi:hypothetical protein
MMEVSDADGGSAMIAGALALLDADVCASAPWLLASVEDILEGGGGGRCVSGVAR